MTANAVAVAEDNHSLAAEALVLAVDSRCSCADAVVAAVWRDVNFRVA